MWFWKFNVLVPTLPYHGLSSSSWLCDFLEIILQKLGSIRSLNFLISVNRITSIAIEDLSAPMYVDISSSFLLCFVMWYLISSSSRYTFTIFSLQKLPKSVDPSYSVEKGRTNSIKSIVKPTYTWYNWVIEPVTVRAAKPMLMDLLRETCFMRHHFLVIVTSIAELILYTLKCTADFYVAHLLVHEGKKQESGKAKRNTKPI